MNREREIFLQEVAERVEANGSNELLKNSAAEFLKQATGPRYSYNFSWAGTPIIQYPQDICAIQEIIFKVNPTLIIETGVAHGGSLMLSASILALLDLRDSKLPGVLKKSNRKVFGIDIDIRSHNRELIESHFLSSYIELFEGSSIDEILVSSIEDAAGGHDTVMVFLDSNHEEAHVLRELNLYSKFVTPGSYLVVFDTMISQLEDSYFLDRPWSSKNNPMGAVDKFLEFSDDFAVDSSIDNKLLISVAPNGYLLRNNS